MFVSKLIAVLFLVGSLSPMAVSVDHDSKKELIYVKGRLTCDKVASYPDSFVAIWNLFNGNEVLVGINGTNAKGDFYVEGVADREWDPTSDAYNTHSSIRFYHRCHHEDLEPNCYWVEHSKEVEDEDVIHNDIRTVEITTLASNKRMMVSSVKECDLPEVVYLKEREGMSETTARSRY